MRDGLPVVRHLPRHLTHRLPEGCELVHQDPGVAVELTDLPPLAPLANLDSPIHTHSPLSRPQEVRMACRLPQPPQRLTLFTPYTTYPTCATQAPLGLQSSSHPGDPPAPSSRSPAILQPILQLSPPAKTL